MSSSAGHDATVHVLSHSLQFGSSAFEGIRCYGTPRGPAIFRLEDHLQRLLDSCKIYRMEVKYSLDELVAACCELVERNNMDACYLRPMVIRGYGASGMVPMDSPVEVYLPCWPWGAYLGEGALENGVDACVSSWNRVAPNTIPAMAKMAGNYLSGQLIKMEALRNGFAEGDRAVTGRHGERGLRAERVRRASRAFSTPRRSTERCLHGITRHSIIALARDMGMTVREQPVPREMLYAADEIFLTGTASEVTPVRSIDRIAIGRRTPRSDHDADPAEIPRSRSRHRRRSIRLADTRSSGASREAVGLNDRRQRQQKDQRGTLRACFGGMPNDASTL